MVGRVLSQEDGPRTHSVFAEGDPEGEEEAVNEEEEGETPKQQTDDILKTFKHVYVNEVVRDSKMWYRRVPRLGSYMAVPLVYLSCLSDEALEAAVADYQDVLARKAELQKEIDAFEEEQNARKEAATAEEPFEPEVREWPTIEQADFISTE